MIVVESPMDALKLLEAGVTVDEVNVGGVTFKPGMTLITEAVSVNDEHVEAYKAINDLAWHPCWTNANSIAHLWPVPSWDSSWAT